MKKIYGIMTCFLIIFLVACESSSSKTTAFENLSFDSYLFGCTFEHPRDWQVGYAFDSGGVALMISDVDPLEVFYYANRTGNEIAISLMGGGEATPDFIPAAYLEKLGKEPINSKIYEFNEADKQFAYVLNEGDLRAVIIHQQNEFYFRGDYPLDQESAVKSGIETILRSFKSLDMHGSELSVPFGQRNEGFLKKGQVGEGYIPLAARSAWEFESEAGQTVVITIETGEPGIKSESDTSVANLNLEMIDPNGKSIFPEGVLSFTDNYKSEKISLPDSGIYTIQVSPLPDQRWWWGWYSIKLTN